MSTMQKSREKERRIKDDLSGCIFGQLTALHMTDKRTKHSSVIWVCKCACGRMVEVPRSYLISDGKTNCGCARRKREKAICEQLHFVDGTCVEFLEKRRRRTDNKTGHVGVSMHGNRYRVNLTFQGKRHYLGTFDTLEEAVNAREAAEKKFYEPFLKRFHQKTTP